MLSNIEMWSNIESFITKFTKLQYQLVAQQLLNFIYSQIYFGLINCRYSGSLSPYMKGIFLIVY